MIGYVEAPRAYWMAQGMARAAGVSLARAVVEGWITRGDLARIVERCGACAADPACRHWLARGNPEVPPFCAIRDDLVALQAFR